MIVVDAGVIVAAVCEHPRHAAALALHEEDPDWLAPELWRAEVRNVIGLKLCLLAGLITPGEAGEAYEDALVLMARGTRLIDSMACLQTLLQYGLSAYDAEYVQLAKMEGTELITTDKRLAKKLLAAGFDAVRLLGD